MKVNKYHNTKNQILVILQVNTKILKTNMVSRMIKNQLTLVLMIMMAFKIIMTATITGMKVMMLKITIVRYFDVIDSSFLAYFINL